MDFSLAKGTRSLMRSENGVGSAGTIRSRRAVAQKGLPFGIECLAPLVRIVHGSLLSLLRPDDGAQQSQFID